MPAAAAAAATTAAAAADAGAAAAARLVRGAVLRRQHVRHGDGGAELRAVRQVQECVRRGPSGVGQREEGHLLGVRPRLVADYGARTKGQSVYQFVESGR